MISAPTGVRAMIMQLKVKAFRQSQSEAKGGSADRTRKRSDRPELLCCSRSPRLPRPPFDRQQSNQDPLLESLSRSYSDPIIVIPVFPSTSMLLHMQERSPGFSLYLRLYVHAHGFKDEGNLPASTCSSQAAAFKKNRKSVCENR